MTHRDPDERREQQVEKSERVVPAHSRKHRCQRHDYTRALSCELDELTQRSAVIRPSPLLRSLVQQKQWRQERDDTDGIADPVMKPGLGKTAPRDHARSSISRNKAARDKPRAD